MPESEAGKEPYVSRTQQRKIDFRNHVGKGAGFVVLLIVLAFVVWFACNVPGHPWRQNDVSLPWRGEGVEVTEAKAQWNSSKGDERMELRALLYPTLHATLGNCSGSGYLHVVFKNPSGHQVGDVCRVPYKDGQFIETYQGNIQAAGKEATFLIETGIKDRDTYLLHKLNMDEPLWRVDVYNAPEGKDEIEELGHVSIPAEDFPGL